VADRSVRCIYLRFVRVARLGAMATCAAVILNGGRTYAQGTPVAAAVPSSQVLSSMTLLRDSFIQSVKAAGFTCTLAPPTILVEDVPSFGQYQPESNTLRTSDWAVLNDREKAFFTQLAGPGADESRTRQLFETAAHRWIFVHELGHWWQACTGGNAKRTHYEVELSANRVALSYWREIDPKVVDTMMPIFQGVVDHVPSPVPTGQSVEDYFNANYETLGPSPAYPWFMSRMNVAALEEKPAPAFASVLASIRH
jgi:hypothetical protein